MPLVKSNNAIFGCSLAAAVAVSITPVLAAEQPASRAVPASIAPLTSTNCSTFCAVINADGTIARAHAFTTSVHEATGEYAVNFNTTATAQKNISKCVWLATPGYGAFGGDLPPVFITVAGRLQSTNGVWIHTYNASGASADEPFLLEISC